MAGALGGSSVAESDPASPRAVASRAPLGALAARTLLACENLGPESARGMPDPTFEPARAPSALTPASR